MFDSIIVLTKAVINNRQGLQDGKSGNLRHSIKTVFAVVSAVGIAYLIRLK